MPAELTDIDSVRQFLQTSANNKLQDDDLETLILQASAGIERYCNRQFFTETAVTKGFEFLPNGTLDLLDCKPTEYRAITSIVRDPDLTPATLKASEWRQWPYPARDGTFFGVRFAEMPEPVIPTGGPTGLTFPFQTRRVDITGDWGIASVPEELEHWANVTVGAWVNLLEGTQPTGETEFVENTVPRAEDLPGRVRRGLTRWVRPTPEA